MGALLAHPACVCKGSAPAGGQQELHTYSTDVAWVVCTPEVNGASRKMQHRVGLQAVQRAAVLLRYGVPSTIETTLRRQMGAAPGTSGLLDPSVVLVLHAEDMIAGCDNERLLPSIAAAALHVCARLQRQRLSLER